MQDLDGAIKYWSVAIGHVHWARRFKLFRSRQYIPPYLALRIIVVLLRRARILPVLVASIREAVQNQEFFQVLESGEPRLGQLSPVAPVGERKIEI